jgi:hypothetical protein
MPGATSAVGRLPARRRRFARMAPPIRCALSVFWELGAEVFSVGVSPDCTNINGDCGALAPEAMR